MVALAESDLGGNQHAEHGRSWHGDAIGIDIDPVEAIKIGLDGAAQCRVAAGVHIEGATLIERFGGGSADEARRRQVAFAEPQRNHRRIVEATERHLGDAVLLEAVDGRAQGQR